MPRNIRTKRAAVNPDQQCEILIPKGQSSLDSSTSNNIIDSENTKNHDTISSTLEIPNANKPISCNSFGAPTTPLAMIFTHGAGGTLSAPAIVNFAKGFSDHKRLLCFLGNMNIQSRTKMFKTVIEHEKWCDVLGGRSMGARSAVLTAQDNENVKALVLVSFPLRNNGKTREQLLLDIRNGIDVLFVSGDCDSMCELGDLRKVIERMKTKTWLVVVKNANHGMEMKQASEAVGRMTGKIVSEWLDQRNDELTHCEVHWDEVQNGVTVRDWTKV